MLLSVVMYVQQLKQEAEYRKWKETFERFIQNKDPTAQPITYLLVYDIDDKKYMIVSDVQASYNQIAVLIAKIPAKSKQQQKEKDEEKKVLIEEYKY